MGWKIHGRLELVFKIFIYLLYITFILIKVLKYINKNKFKWIYIYIYILKCIYIHIYTNIYIYVCIYIDKIMCWKLIIFAFFQLKVFSCKKQILIGWPATNYRQCNNCITEILDLITHAINFINEDSTKKMKDAISST